LMFHFICFDGANMWQDLTFKSPIFEEFLRLKNYK
jgi:hypothetical protein